MENILRFSEGVRSLCQKKQTSQHTKNTTLIHPSLAAQDFKEKYQTNTKKKKKANNWADCLRKLNWVSFLNILLLHTLCFPFYLYFFYAHSALTRTKEYRKRKESYICYIGHPSYAWSCYHRKNLPAKVKPHSASRIQGPPSSFSPWKQAVSACKSGEPCEICPLLHLQRWPELHWSEDCSFLQSIMQSS